MMNKLKKIAWWNERWDYGKTEQCNKTKDRRFLRFSEDPVELIVNTEERQFIIICWKITLKMPGNSLKICLNLEKKKKKVKCNIT